MSMSDYDNRAGQDALARQRQVLEAENATPRVGVPNQPQAVDPEAPAVPGTKPRPNASGVHSKMVAEGPLAAGAGPTVTDSVTPSASIKRDATVHTDAPTLPDPSPSQKTSLKDLSLFAQQATGGYFDTGSLTFSALQAMTEANHQDQSTASRLKRNMESAKITAKSNELKDTKDRIEGEKHAALSKLIATTTGALASGCFAWKGTHMQFTAQAAKSKGQDMAEVTARGAMMQSAGQGVGQSIEALGTLMDKTMGGQKRADDASVREKQEQIYQEVYQQSADAANSWLDVVKDQRKKAQQAILDTFDREKQAVDMVWR